MLLQHLDLAAVKARQQATWASGDYAEIATLIVPIAERLADAADLRAGSTVLDVALRQRQHGDRSRPSRLRRDRHRLRARRCSSAAASAQPPSGSPSTLRHGDAEALPFADASFDATVSVVGSMFAPDHRAHRRRARPRDAARRDDRARELDARRLHRRDVRDDRRARAAAGRPRVADAVGHRGAPRRALRPGRDVDAPRAHVHVPLRVGRGVRRPLRDVLRADR